DLTCSCLRLSFSSCSLALPMSSLFPYTTLFRSIRELCNRVLEDIPPLVGLVAHLGERVVDGRHRTLYRRAVTAIDDALAQMSNRSEEHTSELQSLAYLVCRLLLEKKKKINNTHQ